MLVLLLIFVLLFVGLAVLLGGGAYSIQGNIYSEPGEGLAWRGPAAAAVLTAFYGFWAFLDYQAAAADPNRPDMPYDTIFRFSPKETKDVDQFWSVQNGKEVLFTRERVGTMGKPVFKSQGQEWARSSGTGMVEAIIVEYPPKSGEKIRLEPKLIDGNFPPGESFQGYFEPNGKRSMPQLGQVVVFRWGLFTANLLLNALHFVVWFLSIWLILRFQWMHALLLSAILWGAATWTVPMLLEKTQNVARVRVAGPSAVGMLESTTPAHARMSRTMLPCTSVNRNGRPLNV